MKGFDDPRGRQSEALAFEAEQAARAGRIDQAQDLFAKAAELEELVVGDTPSTEPRVKSVLAVSAVALWYKSRRLGRARLLARHYLATGVPADGESRRELHDLLDLARRDHDDITLKTLSGETATMSDAARRYREVLDEIEWRRLTEPSHPVVNPAVTNELDRLWLKLHDHDRDAIDQEMEALEKVERTGEFFYEDVEPERLAEAGPRTAR